MRKNVIGNYTVTDDDYRQLVSIFKDPLAVQQFSQLLAKVKKSCELELSSASQAFLVNDNPEVRARALQARGKAMVVAELMLLVENVNK